MAGFHLPPPTRDWTAASARKDRKPEEPITYVVAQPPSKAEASVKPRKCAPSTIDLTAVSPRKDRDSKKSATHPAAHLPASTEKPVSPANGSAMQATETPHVLAAPRATRKLGGNVRTILSALLFCVVAPYLVSNYRTYQSYLEPREAKRARSIPLANGMAGPSRQLDGIRTAVHQHLPLIPRESVASINHTVAALSACQHPLEQLGSELGINMAFRLKDVVRAGKRHDLEHLQSLTQQIEGEAVGAARCLRGVISLLDEARATVEESAGKAREAIEEAKDNMVKPIVHFSQGKIRLRDIRFNLRRPFQLRDHQAYEAHRVRISSHDLLRKAKGGLQNIRDELDQEAGLVEKLGKDLGGFVTRVHNTMNATRCRQSDLDLLEGVFVEAVSAAIGPSEAEGFKVYYDAL